MIVSQLPLQTITGLSADPAEILEWGRGVFALVLFTISLYAWSKRKQPALLIVAGAFVLFFGKTVLDVLYPTSTLIDLVRPLFDFIALALFFIAIVIRPRKDLGKVT